MNFKLNDFEKFAIDKGVSTSKINGYNNTLKSRIISPTIIEERPLNVASMDVFSALIREKIIYLSGEIDGDTASVINAQLLYLNSISDIDDTIKMFISSGGGSVIDGLAIRDTCNFVIPDVATYCMGMAASMASILLSSGVRGKRYALPNSTIMIHQVASYNGYLKNADLQIEARESQKWQNILYNILAENTGKTFEEIEKDADRDHWFMPNEALPGVYGTYGLIDEIITKSKE